MKKNPLTHIGGTVPGSDKAVKQHQAAAQGYVVDESPKRVNTVQSNPGKTGSTYVPGLTKKAK